MVILVHTTIFLQLFLFHAIASFVRFFTPRMFRKKKDIEGQRVLITGAGSGVGREIAIEFSKYGTCLLLVDINKKSLSETEKLLDPRSNAFLYECDVSDYKKVYEMSLKVKKDAGDVDILVNNAGIVTGKYLMDLPEERIIKTLEVNVLAHFWMVKAFLPGMMDKNHGHIVSMASFVGMFGGPQMTDYSASKFAAVGFVESLELELKCKGIDGIKFTVVCPSFIDTGLFDGAKFEWAGEQLSSTYVAKRVVTGVLEDQELIILPDILKILILVKPYVSRSLIGKLCENTGVIRSMENFKGRRTIENGYERISKSSKTG